MLSTNRPGFVLYEELERRHLCLVSYFLALALADGVLLSCNTFADVSKRRNAPRSLSYCFKIKEEARSLPIIRGLSSNRTIAKDRILSYGCLNNLIRGVGQRAGYEERLTAYCFRRGFGNVLNCKRKIYCV
jgi:hypothetical protein